jgi:hypothetical protein
VSSKFVRDNVIAFIQAQAPTEKIVDLSGDFGELQDVLTDAGITDSEPWLGIQFLGSNEAPVDIRASNTRGKYRESGIIYLHIVEVARLGVNNPILLRAEALRNKFRGQRISGTIIVETVSPCNFGDGITLNFEGGYTAGLVQVDYQNDIDL